MKKCLLSSLPVAILFCLGMYACKKEQAPAYIVKTLAIKDTTTVGATVEADFIYNVDTDPVLSGICWSIANNPTINDQKVVTGVNYRFDITGLNPGTVYYTRAFATDAKGITHYGEVKSFRTIPATIKDQDGNTYNVITIGKQVWMKENLKTTKFNDGLTAISFNESADLWKNATQAAYCWPNGTIANKDTYGALYNWYAVASGYLAPKGWHVATQNDYTKLDAYFGGDNMVGGKLKEAGNTHWLFFNGVVATNESGFTALPAGSRLAANGIYDSPTTYAYLWTATDAGAAAPENARFVKLYYNSNILDIVFNLPKKTGMSVRCIKD